VIGRFSTPSAHSSVPAGAYVITAIMKNIPFNRDPPSTSQSWVLRKTR
jgi:hypothetical protein